jgi:hypothetical protein
MFPYEFTIFREQNLPGLKLISNGKLLFTRLYTGLMSVIYKRLVHFHIIDTNNGAYYRLWNPVNSSLSLEISFKPGILCSLKKVQ